mgnify:CR=1 FL=1
MEDIWGRAVVDAKLSVDTYYDGAAETAIDGYFFSWTIEVFFLSGEAARLLGVGAATLRREPPYFPFFLAFASAAFLFFSAFAAFRLLNRRH